MKGKTDNCITKHPLQKGWQLMRVEILDLTAQFSGHFTYLKNRSFEREAWGFEIKHSRLNS